MKILLSLSKENKPINHLSFWWQVIFIFLLWITLPFTLHSQSKIWDKSYGGNSDDVSYNQFKSMVPTSDGGFLLGGNSFSRSGNEKTEDSYNDDYWILKINANGSKIWDRTYGASRADILKEIVPTPDGGFLLVGTSYSENNDYLIMKINANGDFLWYKNLGTSENNSDFVLTPTSDSGFLLASTSAAGVDGDKSEASRGSNDYWVIRVDGNGAKLWDKTFGGNGNDSLASIVSTADGGFLLGGTSASGVSGEKSENIRGEQDYWVVKINSIGTKVWDKTYGGMGKETLRSLIVNTEGNFLLGGHSTSGVSADKSEANRGSTDYWIIKINETGIKLWDKTFGGNNNETLNTLVTSSDGAYFLSGFSDSGVSGDKSEESRGDIDFWIVKINNSGIKLWDKTLGTSENQNLISWMPLEPKLVSTADGGFILGSSSGANIGGDKTENRKGKDEYIDYWVIKVDGNGIKQWDNTIGSNGDDSFHDLIIPPDGGYLIGGSSDGWLLEDDKTDPNSSAGDYWIVKLEDNGRKEQAIVFDLIPKKTLGNAPFPLTATSSSGLPVSFSIISGPATVADNIITLTGTGVVEVKAYQAGNDTYVAAPDVINNFLILAKGQPVQQADKTFGGDADESMHSVIQTKDGGYLLGGSSKSGITGDKSQINQGNFDLWVIKLDKDNRKLWDKSFGGSDRDLLYSILETPDGGYLLGGYSTSGIGGDKSETNRSEQSYNGDYWIVKIDENGNKLWDKTLGGNADDFLYKVVATPDGGYLLGGSSNSNVSGEKSQGNRGNTFTSDYWVVKIDANGNKIWDKTYGDSGNDQLRALITIPNGGYMLGGTSQSYWSGQDYHVIKIDEAGNTIWDRAYGGDSSDLLFSMVATSDGFLLGGSSRSDYGGSKSDDSRGFDDYWVVKTDANGTKIWDKTFGGDRNDYLEGLAVTPDGGFLLGGYSVSGLSGDKSETSRRSYDYWIVNIDKNGNKLWDQTFGSNGSDILTDLINTKDGGYIMAGFSNSDKGFEKSEDSPGGNDYWIVKLKEEYTPPLPVSTWNKTFGGKSFERLTSVVKTSDGGYLLGGHSLSRIGGDRTQDTQGRYDYWIVKTDATGSKLWEQSYGGSNDDYLNQIIPTADGGYLLAGSSQSGIGGDKTTASRGDQDFWIVKVDASGNKLWDKSYGGNGFEDLMQALQLSTGEYLLAGVSASDISGEKSQNRRGSRDYWLLKVSATGAKLWDQRYGGSKAEELSRLLLTNDGFVLGGSSLSGKSGDKISENKGGKDYWLVKVNSQGTLMWEKSYGGSGEDVLAALAATTSGELMLAGHSASGVSGDKSSANRGSSDYWLLQVSSNGEKLWNKTYGGSGQEELSSLIETSDNGWLLGGSSFSNRSGEKSQNSQGSSDYWVIKLDEAGEKQWDQTYGGTGEDRLRYLLQTKDQGYLLAGFSFSDANSDKSQDSQGRSDYWIVKIPPVPATQTRIAPPVIATATTPETMEINLKAYPIPAAEKITVQFTLPESQVVELRLCNSQGAQVQTLFTGEAQAHKTYQVGWQPGRQDSNGLYILQMQTKKHNQSLKFLLIR